MAFQELHVGEGAPDRVLEKRGALRASGVVSSPHDAEQDLNVGVLVRWLHRVCMMFCWLSKFLKASYFCKD